MNKIDQWLLYVANALVGGTGLVYAWMRYLLEPVDEFAVANHPWQPDVQHLHILTAPLLVLVIGHVAYHHAVVYWKADTRPGRRTGLTMLALAMPMILSGYLLQTAVSETWRITWIVIHVSTSVIWLAGFSLHLVTHARNRRSQAIP
jgi:hypothetical protein